MPDIVILVPNYARETFRKTLTEYPAYPQLPVKNRKFIIRRLSVFFRPRFYEFDAEFSFGNEVVAVIARKIDNDSSGVPPQLEDKVSLFRDGQELGNTRAFKVIDTANPFRIVESGIRDRRLYRQYLTSICHLAVCLDKEAMKNLEPILATTLRYSASVAAVTNFCLSEQDEAVVTRCQDIPVAPLLPRGLAPLASVNFRYAGQR